MRLYTSITLLQHLIRLMPGIVAIFSDTLTIHLLGGHGKVIEIVQCTVKVCSAHVLYCTLHCTCTVPGRVTTL